MKKLKILALNPFHGGSHKAFLDNWIKRSVHDFTLITLPGSQWRWRLHFAAVEFSQQVKELYEQGNRWDTIFCTSMMNVAEFRGLCPFLVSVPLTVYFHENQLTYPESKNVKFNLGLCMKNVNSSLAADRVWFNSHFHKNDFLKAVTELLSKKPGSPVEIVEKINDKSSVQYQGINEEMSFSPAAILSPVHLLWASRWEEDKNPGLLFKALKILKENNIAFKVSILGEEMKTRMECFKKAEEEFSDEIIHFGFLESRKQYRQVLKDADIFISTADHEFFGIAAVEAVAAGCIPVLPDHLAYPEVLSDFQEFFYKPRSSVGLAQKIIDIVNEAPLIDNKVVEKYFWPHTALSLDTAIQKD